MRKAKSSVDSASTWGHYQSAFCTIKIFKPFRPTYAAPATEAPETKLESLRSQNAFLHMPSDLSRATGSKQQLNKPLLRIGCDGGFCLLTGLFSKAFNMDFWSLQGSWQEFLANKLERCTKDAKYGKVIPHLSCSQCSRFKITAKFSCFAAPTLVRNRLHHEQKASQSRVGQTNHCAQGPDQKWNQQT